MAMFPIRGTTTPLDYDGQPLFRAFRSEAIIDRQIDELIGLVKGVLADGHVNLSEAEFVLNWLHANRAARDQWPARVLYPRLASALSDGVMDEQEERDVLELLMHTVGDLAAPQDGEGSAATGLPYSSPPPLIEFADRRFCFTGKFFCGTRNYCGHEVARRGGRVDARVTRSLDFLVIGTIGSRDWLHSTHGRKIEAALKCREAGHAVHIVSEEYWHSHLTDLDDADGRS